MQLEIKSIDESLTNNPTYIGVGAVLFIGPFTKRGNRGAYVMITKVNKKTYKGIELKQSDMPGTEWTISKETSFAIVSKSEKGYEEMRWNYR